MTDDHVNIYVDRVNIQHNKLSFLTYFVNAQCIQTLYDGSTILKKSTSLGQITLPANYEIEFDLTVNSVTNGLTNILHFTQTDTTNSRVPSMYLNSGTSTLLVTQDSDKKLNQFRSLSSPLPIGQKVRVKVSEIDRMLKVYVNGAYYYSFTVDGNRPVGPTKIYMSNPWENPASATIGNVQINTCPTVSLAAPSSSCAPVTLLSDFKQIERDTYLGRVTLKEDYRLDFDINLKQIPTTWVNVLHFTKGDSDITTVGDRAPAVWIIPNKAKLFVSQDAGSQKNLGIESSLTIPIGTKVHVTIIAIGDTLKVYVGETLYESITIPNPYSVFTLPGLKPTGDVHVYASDPWYTSPNAELGAVIYNPCPTLPKLLVPSNSCSKVNVYEGTTFIEKNTLLGSVNVLGDYAIEFDLTINGIVDGWANILHLTQSGRNLGTVGDRIPGIWLFPGK
ncbi:hypothetical protein BC833DRAFT_662734, partial [Globomyces pollinis-pini]